VAASARSLAPNVMFEGGFRRDGFEQVLRRVGGATGVFWEACVGVASRASPRAADQTTGISKAAMYCSAGAARAAARRGLVSQQ